MAASALGAQSLGRWLDVKPTKSNVGTSSNELGFRRSQVFGDLKLSTACEAQQQQKQQQMPWVVVARRVCPFTGKRPNRANKVSYSKHKTKRWQHVNLQRKRMWWEAGKRFLKLRLSTSAIRTIEKNGIDAVAMKAGIDLNTL